MSRHAFRLLVAHTLLLAGTAAGHADIAPPFGWGNGARRPLPPRPPALCTKVPIHAVDSAHLERHGDTGTLFASGSASASGWHDAELRFITTDPGRGPAPTAIYELVACPPESGAAGATPLAATIPVALAPGQPHRFLVKAETNAQTVTLDAPLPRP